MLKFLLTLGLAIAGLVAGWQFGLQNSDISIQSDSSFESQTLPDSDWTNIGGGQNKLTDWQGNVLIVNHWATWCEPCRREIPMFRDFRDQHVGQGLELIGIAHDDEDDVRRYVDAMGMNYPQLLAGDGQGQKWLVELGSGGSIPLTLIFDREGRLRARKIGVLTHVELRNAVEPLLEKS
jgi:thiol-disulfide isomerase/thioredoxin